MPASRLPSKPPKGKVGGKKESNDKGDDKPLTSIRNTTTNQPMRGGRLTEREWIHSQKMVDNLRKKTGKNVNYAKMIRALSYLHNNEKIYDLLGDVLLNELD